MTYFITEAYIKNNTPITKNVDVTDVTPYIKSVSDMRIQAILGSVFYNDILTKYNAQTLSANETTLVEYIQPVVAWYAASDAAFGLSYQLKNKGVQQQFGDFSQQVSQGEVAFTMDHYGQKARFYEARLKAWLIENKALFTIFISESNKDTDLRPYLLDCDDNLDNYDSTMIVF